eukprot:Lankesteria_metandrocarpae@DN5188_c0_g1_i3.p1
MAARRRQAGEMDVEKQSLLAGGAQFDLDTDQKYDWQSPNKFWYGLLCFGGCGMNYTTQCVLAAVCTGSLVFGLNLSLLNTSIGTIGGQFLWCGYEGYRGCNDFKWYSAFVQVGVFVGAAIGAMTAGNFVKRLGCRRVFYMADVIVAIGICLSCYAKAFNFLVVARLVVGVGVGVLAVSVPTYISEVTPPSKRGSYGVLHQLLITFGILIGVLIGLPFSIPPVAAPGLEQPTTEQRSWELTDFDRIWWRVMLGLGILPIIAQLALFKFVFSAETPYYLIGQKKYSEAYALLKTLAGTPNVQNDFNDIYDSVESSSSASGLSLGSIISDKNGRWALFVGTMISALQQLTGINVFITSSNALFADAGLDQDLVTIMSIVLTVVNFLMTFPSIYLIEALGRKMLLLIGTAGMGISVLPGAVWLFVDPTCTAASWTAIAGAMLFIIFFSVTWGPTVWVYLFEIFPADMKDSAAGFMTAFNWIAGIAMVFAGSWMPTDIGYIVFFVFNVLGFVFVLLFMKETRNITVGQSPFFQ